MAESLLPRNAEPFERSLEQVMNVTTDCSIGVLWQASACPDALLYVLAFTLGVDEWDESWSRDLKESAILGAYNVHSVRGTPASLRRLFKNSGFGEIDIAEGLNISARDGSKTYNGHFFHRWEEAWAQYRIYLQKALTNAQADRLRTLIEDTAPLHTELAGLHFEKVVFIHNSAIVRDGQYNYGVA